jgi:ABC-type Mn2+/Zn2+ transport system ATPase subunit
MLESDARLVERSIQVKGRKYKQLIIYVPRSLATDSAFPFKPEEMVRIIILGNTLKVQKAKLPHAAQPVPDTLLPIVEILSPGADNVDEHDSVR